MSEFKIMREDLFKYDAHYDIMHVFLDNYSDSQFYYADEERKDINVLRSEDTDEIAGFLIMEYSKHIEELKKYYSQYFAKVPDLKEMEMRDNESHLRNTGEILLNETAG